MKRAIKILLAFAVMVVTAITITVFASADTYVDRDWAVDYYYSDEVRSYSPYEDDPTSDFEADVVYIERYTDDFYCYNDLLFFNIEGTPTICGSSEGYHKSDTETFCLDEESCSVYSTSGDSFTCWYDSSFAITFVIVDDISQYRSSSDYVLIAREFDMDVLITNEYVTADHSSHPSHYCEPDQSYRKIYFESGFGSLHWNDVYFPEIYGFSSLYVDFWPYPYCCADSTGESCIEPESSLEYNPLNAGFQFTLGFYNSDVVDELFYFDCLIADDPSSYIKTSSDSGDGDDSGEIEIPGEIPGLDGPPPSTFDMIYFIGYEGSFSFAAIDKMVVNYSVFDGKSVNAPMIKVSSNTGFINECLVEVYRDDGKYISLSDPNGHTINMCYSPSDVIVSSFYQGGVLKSESFNYSDLVSDDHIYDCLFNGVGLYLVTICADVDLCGASCIDCYGVAYFSFYVLIDMSSSSIDLTPADKLQDAYDRGFSDGLGSLEGSGSYDEGFSDGFKSGESYGYQNGYDDGEVAGFDRGYTSGHEQGLKDGELSSSGAYYDEGYSAGYKAGCNDTSSKFVSDKSAAYTQGFQDGMESVIDTPGDAISGFFYGISGSTINFLDYTSRNIHVGSVSLFRIIEFFIFVVFGFFVVKFIIKAVTSLI